MPTVITLSPPRDPASGRHELRRWILTVAIPRRSGRRIELAGVRFDDTAGAMAAANAELGFEATWTPAGRSYRAEPLVIGTEAAA
jgi:hypothetical protein